MTEPVTVSSGLVTCRAVTSSIFNRRASGESAATTIVSSLASDTGADSTAADVGSRAAPLESGKTNRLIRMAGMANAASTIQAIRQRVALRSVMVVSLLPARTRSHSESASQPHRRRFEIIGRGW